MFISSRDIVHCSHHIVQRVEQYGAIIRRSRASAPACWSRPSLHSAPLARGWPPASSAHVGGLVLGPSPGFTQVLEPSEAEFEAVQATLARLIAAQAAAPREDFLLHPEQDLLLAHWRAQRSGV